MASVILRGNFRIGFKPEVDLVNVKFGSLPADLLETDE